MNLVCRAARVGGCAPVIASVLVLALLAGCGPARSPTAAELAAFANAGPVRPKLDLDSLVKAKLPAGPYRVVAGDVLEVQIPTIMPEGAAASASTVQLFLCRVDESGEICLPIVGQIQTGGKTLPQIESAVTAAYHPKYVLERPSVVARVAEHHTTGVSVLGAVSQPGIYRLRSDEMSLVALLMKAGGIVEDGASAIRVNGTGEGGKVRKLVLPVKGLSIPFADVALQGGETVEVERLDPQLFTVTGLVNKPGAFPYPPGASYSLLQALAFAGGIDDTADPRYAKIYRQDAEGKILAAVFPISSKHLTQAPGIAIKPGDVVAVEHTPRTRTRRALAGVFRIGTGAYLGATYNLNPGQ